MVNYRLATKEDVASLANLHAESWRNTYRGLFADVFLDQFVWEDRKAVWSSRMTDPKTNQYVLVAIEENRLCGFICAYGDESAEWGTFIDNLHVDATCKGKGIGRELMTRVAQWVDNSFSKKGLYLEVLEANQSARRFYENLGARHQDTKWWLPPGSHQKVRDLLYVWDDLKGLV